MFFSLQWYEIYLFTHSFHPSIHPIKVVASKYLQDEGEMEAFVNSEWAKIGTYNSLNE
jgi:hypothetical protein